MKPIIELRHVSAAYDGKEVLTDESLTVCEQDFLGIVGPNGSGKTTLIRILLGLMKPSRGEVLYYRNGEPTDRLRMGYLPQTHHIDRRFPISVRDTVLSGLTGERGLFAHFKPTDHQAVNETLRLMEIEELAERPIGSLSGGQLQRTLLGRALVSRPEVLVLDEPDTYLDSHSQTLLHQLLRAVCRSCAIVLVSHRPESVQACDRVMELNF